VRKWCTYFNTPQRTSVCIVVECQPAVQHDHCVGVLHDVTVMLNIPRVLVRQLVRRRQQPLAARCEGRRKSNAACACVGAGAMVIHNGVFTSLRLQNPILKRCITLCVPLCIECMSTTAGDIAQHIKISNRWGTIDNTVEKEREYHRPVVVNGLQGGAIGGLDVA
jgi:hypothetical protein